MCVSVRLSVYHTPVLYQNGYCQPPQQTPFDLRVTVSDSATAHQLRCLRFRGRDRQTDRQTRALTGEHTTQCNAFSWWRWCCGCRRSGWRQRQLHMRGSWPQVDCTQSRDSRPLRQMYVHQLLTYLRIFILVCYLLLLTFDRFYRATLC